MANPIAKVKNPALLSRFEHLAAEAAILIDKSYTDGKTLARGVLMGKQVTGGKYRPYVEAEVKTGGNFATNSTAGTLDLSTQVGPVAFQAGDVIETVAGTAIGTISTINASTGAIVLTGNASNAVSAGTKVRIATSQLALDAGKGKILKDEVQIDGLDQPAVGYFEGFFIQANTTVTDAALTAMSGKTIDSGEIRLV